MGTVYEAMDLALERRVAIKFLSPHMATAAARDRLRVEARAIARLNHPNIVAVYQAAWELEQPHLVSEFVSGGSLDQLALPLPWSRVLRLAVQMTRALVAAHGAGVLHRDLKPANVLLDLHGDAKLCDFGLAKLREAPSAEPGDSPPRLQTQAVDLSALPLDATVSLPGAVPRVNAAASPALQLTSPGALLEIGRASCRERVS
jgi:serine/threonine protein kinase